MAHLFIIAGHGAGDPGACGNGYTEAERVRALARRIKALGGDAVTVGDMSRDFYADNGISMLDIPKDWQIVELHMDSGVSTARGGHVIINAGFTADAHDNALAAMLQDILPGRANLIVGRSDLANPGRAAVKGYGYRLVEFGFITNAADVNIFKSRMDDIARGVLNAFGIGGSAGKWIRDKKGWWYKYPNGSWPKSQWLQLDAWYYFNDKGYALSGQWLQYKGKWYYLQSDCRMATGWIKVKGYWYYLNKNGDMQTGWQKLNGHWYYLRKTASGDGPEGSAVTGWLQDGDYKYYLHPKKDESQPECAAAAGWTKVGGVWYYFNMSANCQPVCSMMRNHWITEEKKRYYLKENGQMARNEVLLIGEKEYEFDGSGAGKQH